MTIQTPVAVAKPRIPLTEQIEEVAREIRQRERLYPRWIAEGRYKQETADKKVADLNAALATLVFIEKHAEPLRLLIATLQQYNPYDRVLPDSAIEDVLKHPSVRAVMEAFPNAIVEDVRPYQAASDDLFAVGD